MKGCALQKRPASFAHLGVLCGEKLLTAKL